MHTTSHPQARRALSHTTLLLTTSLGAALIWVACEKSAPAAASTTSAPMASSAEPATPGPLVAVPAGALPFGSGQGSTLGFFGKKVTGSHEGAFERFDGYLKMEKNMLRHVELAIDVASVKTDSAKLDGHLRSPDFFDVATHPTARFVSTAIEEGGDDGVTHIVVGDFTLRGKTKSIRVPIGVALTPTTASATGKVTINRQDFGVAYPGRPDDLISDDVEIRFSVVAPRPADTAPAEPAAPEVGTPPSGQGT